MMHATHVSSLQVAENSTAKESATILLLKTPSHVVADYFDEGGGVLMVDETASASGNPEKIRSTSQIS